jgi:NADH-quinone oxidoreductase subunit M
MSSLASLGLIAATIYSLRIMQKVFLGNKNIDWEISDLNFREKIVSASLVIVIVGLGLFPKPVFEISKPAIMKTLDSQKVNIPQDFISVKKETPEKPLFHFLMKQTKD